MLAKVCRVRQKQSQVRADGAFSIIDLLREEQAKRSIFSPIRCRGHQRLHANAAYQTCEYQANNEVLTIIDLVSIHLINRIITFPIKHMT
jgi:hypothetical protein